MCAEYRWKQRGRDPVRCRDGRVGMEGPGDERDQGRSVGVVPTSATHNG